MYSLWWLSKDHNENEESTDITHFFLSNTDIGIILFSCLVVFALDRVSGHSGYFFIYLILQFVFLTAWFRQRLVLLTKAFLFMISPFCLLCGVLVAKSSSGFFIGVGFILLAFVAATVGQIIELVLHFLFKHIFSEYLYFVVLTGAVVFMALGVTLSAHS